MSAAELQLLHCEPLHEMTIYAQNNPIEAMPGFLQQAHLSVPSSADRHAEPGRDKSMVVDVFSNEHKQESACHPDKHALP